MQAFVTMHTTYPFEWKRLVDIEQVIDLDLYVTMTLTLENILYIYIFKFSKLLMDNRTLASRDFMFYYRLNMSFSKQVVFRGLGSTSVLSASFIVHKNVYKCQISFYIRIVGDDSVSVWCYSFNVLSMSMYTYSNISYLLSYILYLISYI